MFLFASCFSREVFALAEVPTFTRAQIRHHHSL
nr:MAG TPA: hypothetical protein [Caudoviricetes sp.]